MEGMDTDHCGGTQAPGLIHNPLGIAKVDAPSPMLPGPPLTLEAEPSPQRGTDGRTARLMERISFAADEVFVARLRRAKQVLPHKYPEGRLEDVLGDALEVPLDKKDMDRIIARRARRKA